MVYCQKCGAANPDEQILCTQCGAQITNNDRPQKPQNYLVWSIITTIVCCLIGGIVAIVYSAKVDSLYNAGDYAGANEASQNARKWNIGSMIVGAVVNIAYIAMMMAGAFLSARN